MIVLVRGVAIDGNGRHTVQAGFEDALEEVVVTGDDRAALAAGDVLGSVEGEDRHIAEAARLVAAILALEAMRSVFDDANPAGFPGMVVDHASNALDVAKLAIDVDRHDGARALGDVLG